MEKETTIVYITAGSAEEAGTIGKKLVEERLAASVNIFSNIHSIYWWDGKMREEPEAVLIAKTRKALFPELTAKVKAMHSYAIPCILSLPIAEGYEPFLQWILKETKAPV